MLLNLLPAYHLLSGVHVAWILCLPASFEIGVLKGIRRNPCAPLQGSLLTLLGVWSYLPSGFEIGHSFVHLFLFSSSVMDQFSFSWNGQNHATQPPDFIAEDTVALQAWVTCVHSYICSSSDSSVPFVFCCHSVRMCVRERTDIFWAPITYMSD